MKQSIIAAMVGLGVLAVAIPGPAAADEPTTKRKEIRTVIIENDGKGEKEVTIDGDDPAKMALKCPGVLTEVEAAPAGTADKKDKARIVICSQSGSRAEAAKGLERALADIDKNDEMDAGVKAELKAKLTAKIAELRAAS